MSAPFPAGEWLPAPWCCKTCRLFWCLCLSLPSQRPRGAGQNTGPPNPMLPCVARWFYRAGPGSLPPAITSESDPSVRGVTKNPRWLQSGFPVRGDTELSHAGGWAPLSPRAVPCSLTLSPTWRPAHRPRWLCLSRLCVVSLDGRHSHPIRLCSGVCALCHPQPWSLRVHRRS